LQNTKNVVKKVAYLVSYFIFSIVVQWIFFESVKLVRESRSNIIASIIVLIMGIFLQMILYNFIESRIFIIIGVFIFTTGLMAYISNANMFWVNVVILGYGLLINPLWENSLKTEELKSNNLIINVMALVFGLIMSNITLNIGYYPMSREIIIIIIIMVILLVIMVNWFMPKIRQTDFKEMVQNKYRFHIGIWESISIGFYLLIIIIGSDSGTYLVSIYGLSGELNIGVEILIMGMMIILSIVYINSVEKVNSRMRWIYDINLILTGVITIIFFSISYCNGIWSPYLIEINGIISFCSIFILLIIQKNLESMWWMSFSLIITFSGYLLLEIIPSLILPIMGLIVLIYSIFNRENVLTIVPTLMEIENEI